jgi:DNA-binding NtrC family response regulator
MMRDAVTAAINATGGNKSEAARMLGKSRRALVRLSEKYGLPKGKRYTKKVRNRLSDEL